MMAERADNFFWSVDHTAFEAVRMRFFCAVVRHVRMRSARNSSLGFNVLVLALRERCERVRTQPSPSSQGRARRPSTGQRQSPHNSRSPLPAEGVALKLTTVFYRYGTLRKCTAVVQFRPEGWLQQGPDVQRKPRPKLVQAGIEGFRELNAEPGGRLNSRFHYDDARNRGHDHRFPCY